MTVALSSEENPVKKKSLSHNRSKRPKESASPDSEGDHFEFMVGDAILQEATKPFQPRLCNYIELYAMLKLCTFKKLHGC